MTALDRLRITGAVTEPRHRPGFLARMRVHARDHAGLLILCVLIAYGLSEIATWALLDEQRLLWLGIAR